MGEGPGLVAVIGFLLWPLLFSGTTLFFSEKQKVQLEELGRVKASIWKLSKSLCHTL